jgi:hypothetical protein
MSLMNSLMSPMQGHWKLQLEDGTHEVAAQFGLLGRLTITWDGLAIHSGQVWLLLGELQRFEQNGHSFVVSIRGVGRLGTMVLSMDGADVGASAATVVSAAPSAAPAPVAVQFVKELSCTETEEVVGAEEYPLDNRFGSSPFSTDRQVSKESTNEFSIDVTSQVSGHLSLEMVSVLKAEVTAEVSRQVGCKIGEKVTESQTLHFTVGQNQSVLYQVVWKRKVRTGERLYMANGAPVTVPYRVNYGLCCEVRTLQPPTT